MQQIALSWLIYRMTGSPFLLGLVGFLNQAPSLLLTPFAGVLADRHSRRNMVLMTQSLFMAQAAVLTFLVMTGQIQVWHIMVLSACLGILFSFDIPIRQSFTVEMIEDREDLGNAIALNSSMLNAARLLGPALAGILIMFIGEGVCFLLNTFSFIPVLWSLASMKLPRTPPVASSRHILVELKEGFRYAYDFAPIRWILILLGLVSMMGVPLQVLMPVFARDIFQGGPHTLGFLMGMFGLGALIGALTLAAKRNVLGLVRAIAWTAVFLGAMIVFFALSRNLAMSMVVLLLFGFGVMVNMAASNTVLQTLVDEDKRGRVMGLYTLAFMGTMPFGSLLAGILAAKIGAPLTLLICGVCCVLGSVAFLRKLPALRKAVRPVYVQKGIILPEVGAELPGAIPE